MLTWIYYKTRETSGNSSEKSVFIDPKWIRFKDLFSFLFFTAIWPFVKKRITGMNNNVAVQQLLQLMMSKYLLLKQSILLCFSSTFCTLWLCNKIHCDVHDHLSSGSMCFFCVLVSSFGYGFCDVLMFPSSCFRYLFCHDLMHQMK